MRSLVGGFGIACAAVVVWTVANAGYISEVDPAARWNMAFLYGVIAAFGLLFHGVAMRVWRRNRIASILIGIGCASALLINLSNSLSALAGRNIKATAEATDRAQKTKDDRAELARLQRQLEALGKFTPTDEDAVRAARRAADTATKNREAECGKRGANCRSREAEEQSAATRLTETAAAKAATDRASKIEVAISRVQDRLRAAGPDLETNVQGNALAKLFRLPASEAGFVAVLQNFLMAAVVEAIIVLCMVAFEVLRDEEIEQDKIEQEQAELAPLVVPPPKPRLVASEVAPAWGVLDFLLERVVTKRGSELEIEDLYVDYATQCRCRGLRALEPEQFAEPMKKLCKECGIPYKTVGGMVYLMNVGLAA